MADGNDDKKERAALPYSFDELIRTHSVPVLVEFFSRGRSAKPGRVIAEAARHFGSRLLTVTLDVDKHPEIAEEHGILAVPAFVMFFKGFVVMRYIGSDDPDELKQRIELHWPYMN
jgi:thioredoxin-like negative regulator of GroEL